MEAIFLSDYLEISAKISPKKEAIIYKDRKISYDEFFKATKNLAKFFLKIGIKKGDRIAVLMPNCPEYLFAYMASSMIGAITVGLNPLYKGPEISYFLNNSSPKVLLMFDNYQQINYQKIIFENIYSGAIRDIIIYHTQPKKKNLLRNAYDFEKILSQDHGIPDKKLQERRKLLSPDDGVLIIHTLGTTGKHKAVVLSHNNIISSRKAQIKQWEITSEDRILLHLHISHIGGNAVISGLMERATFIIMDHFNPVEALTLIEKEKVTFLGQVPTMYIMMFNVENFDRYALSSLRICTVAGAPAQPEIMKKIYTMSRGTLRTGYGLAETSGLVTYTTKDDPLETIIQTVGKPAPGVAVKVVDDKRTELPRGETGEIAIRGDCVFKKYYELPLETEKAVDKEGWFYTGDIGVINEDGYIRLLGHKKDIIITGGFKIFPQEIEAKLMKHPQIQLAAVCAVPDPVLGEIGRAYIVPKGDKLFKQSEIISYLEESLADFKVPRQFTFRKSLPLMPTGKVEKKFLQEEIANEG